MKKSLGLENYKLMALDLAKSERKKLKEAGKRLVFTNGCFDLLHVGHLSYLKAARALGNCLWIGLNGEESVRALKGPGRPIQSDEERAYALSALECVDGIIIFSNKRVTDEILALQPDIYTKAGDYTFESLDVGERGALEVVGAEIHFMPFLEGYSSTALIEKIAAAAGTF